ncbi:MAG: cytochrome b/b6 domain-containing protein [Myxococcales bacterium]|nr:cytochrome b/b6 domain-containing protein [Myxococcales bacterium]
MKVTREVNPFWLRLWHALQAACFFGLLISGLSMHFSDAKVMHLPFRIAVHVHNGCGVAYVGLWVFFLIANLTTGHVRHYLPSRKKHGHNLVKQIRFYLYGMFRGEPHPFPPSFRHKFNPVQKFAYTTVMYVLTPLSAASGLTLLFPLVAPEEAAGMTGLLPVAMVHLAVGYLISVFLVFHIYLATTGETVGSYYAEMLTGIRISDAPPSRPPRSSHSAPRT